MARVELDAEVFSELCDKMESFGVGAGQVVDEVLHKEGGTKIKNEIMRILPASGRVWMGKEAPAANAQPFTQEDGSLSVVVKTVNKYHYLYFPDDGSSTKRHIGNQEFMIKGAEKASESIIDRCVSRLIENF